MSSVNIRVEGLEENARDVAEKIIKALAIEETPAVHPNNDGVRVRIYMNTGDDDES